MPESVWSRGEIAGGAGRRGEVREVRGEVARARLVDGQRAQVERHRLRVLVLVAEGVAQVDEVLGHLRVTEGSGQ